MRYMSSFQDSWPSLFKVITRYAFRIHESFFNFMKIFNRYDWNFVTSDSLKFKCSCLWKYKNKTKQLFNTSIIPEGFSMEVNLLNFCKNFMFQWIPFALFNAVN